MCAANKFDDHTWNRFFDFIFPDESTLTYEEVKADLKNAGIDLNQAFSRLHMKLNQIQEVKRNKAQLESAKKSRPSVVSKLKETLAESAVQMREKIQQLIEKRFSGTEQAVYARKLEKASDEDLRSLLDDLCRLDSLSDGSNDDNK